MISNKYSKQGEDQERGCLDCKTLRFDKATCDASSTFAPGIATVVVTGGSLTGMSTARLSFCWVSLHSCHHTDIVNNNYSTMISSLGHSWSGS